MKSCISKKIPEGCSTGNRALFYYITDRRQLAGLSLESCVRRALKWGVDFIQIREKDLSDRLLFEQALSIVHLARGTQCKILVNGRADIALAAGAHGVHLPSSGLRISDIRPWLPDRFLIGTSAHTAEEIERAGEEGADYAILGHVFPTSSKTGLGKPVGLKLLKKVCKNLSIPVFALGGIHAGRIESVLRAGAAGVAGISLFQKEEEYVHLENLKDIHK